MKDQVGYMNEFTRYSQAAWSQGVTTRYELALARACDTIVQRDAALAEMDRRYKRALKALRLAKRAFNRFGYEDGPTDSEVIDVIVGILADERLEKEIARKSRETRSDAEVGGILARKETTND